MITKAGIRVPAFVFDVSAMNVTSPLLKGFVVYDIIAKHFAHFLSSSR